MINVQEKRDRILSYIETNGPSLPVRIAKAIEMDPVFASAIASELISSKIIITSNMKIGSSPLYMIAGQEKQLEKFTDNLKSVEKEAYLKLKENKLIIDDDESPVIRVALRNLKDFAVPFKFQGKIMWKYAFIPQEEIQELLSPKKEFLEIKKEVEDRSEISEEVEEKFIEIEKPKTTNEEIIETNKIQENEPIFQEAEVPKAWEKKKEEVNKIKKESMGKENKEVEDIFTTEEEATPEPEFLKRVKTFLKKKDIEFLEEIRTEKKEVVATVKITSQLGDINMLLVAKDKKTTNKDEIKGAIQMATNGNMPCLLIIGKEPTKTVQNIIEENNLVKLEIMK